MALLNSPLQTFMNIPPATKAFTIITVLLSGTYLYLSSQQISNEGASFPYLVMVPGSAVWYPWTIITSGFVELHFIELIVTLITIPLSLRYLERLWGAIETIKFVLITIGVSNLIGLFVNWLEFVLFGHSEVFLYGMVYRGQSALQVGVLVAFTQIIPEHQVQLFGILKIRVKRLPMLYVTFSNIMCIVGYQVPFILIQFGWLVSWVYLRFYKRTGSEVGNTLAGGMVETYGDRSEAFAFVHWFPPFLHTPVSMLSVAVYDIAVRLRLVQPYPTSPDLELGGGYAALPGGARAEAERRRAMALKALDQRLASSSNPNGNGMPTKPLPTASFDGESSSSAAPIRAVDVPPAPDSAGPQAEEKGKGKGKSEEGK